MGVKRGLSFILREERILKVVKRQGAEENI
jgi:hypothetical protein